MATTTNRLTVQSEARDTGLTVGDVLDFATALADAKIDAKELVERISNSAGGTVQLIAVSDVKS